MVDPVVAARSCDDCQKYVWNDEPGKMGDTIIRLAGGQPWERPPQSPTPCQMCPKVPHDRRTATTTRADAIEPTERSWSILWHYRKCKAVGRFPDDPLVERHAGLIHEVESAVERARLEHTAGMLSLLFKSH